MSRKGGKRKGRGGPGPIPKGALYYDLTEAEAMAGVPQQVRDLVTRMRERERKGKPK